MSGTLGEKGFAAGAPLPHLALSPSMPSLSSPLFSRLGMLRPAFLPSLPCVYPHIYQQLLANMYSKPDPPLPKVQRATPPPGGQVPLWASEQKRAEPEPSPAKRPKRRHAGRKLLFDDETTSPVSGMFIREASEKVRSGGDIAQSLNLVDVSDEARAELARIPNVIGDYVCQLCKEKFSDAFLLAAHSCPRIGHVEYRCPECNKVFNCPANLASHQRWHKPWKHSERSTSEHANGLASTSPGRSSSTDTTDLASLHAAQRSSPAPLDLTMPSLRTADSKDWQPGECKASPELEQGEESSHQCSTCGRRFTQHAYLRRHAISHSPFACGHPPPEHQCPRCACWFPSPDQARSHSHVCSANGFS